MGSWKSLPAAITSRPVSIVPRQTRPGCAPAHGLTRTPYSAPFDRDGEVLALALDRVRLAVELADPDDAVEERGVAVVVEDEVAVGRPVADVSGGGIVPFGRASSDSSRGSGAVFSTLLWSRKVSVSGS
jgi:hypothetical protein